MSPDIILGNTVVIPFIYLAHLNQQPTTNSEILNFHQFSNEPDLFLTKKINKQELWTTIHYIPEILCIGSVNSEFVVGSGEQDIMIITITTKAFSGLNLKVSNNFTLGLFNWVTSKKQDMAVITCLDVSRIPKQLGLISDM
jgi:hypothetical protein